MPRRASDFDKTLGERIRSLREQHGMSQTDIGAKLGVSFQQVQKYEKGRNRLCSKKAVIISKIFGVSLNILLDENETEIIKKASILLDDDGRTIVQSYEKMTPDMRKALAEMCQKAVATVTEK